MTAQIINLRRARKTKARTLKAEEAEHNRAQFGRTKAQRALSAAEAEQAARKLDGARIAPQTNNDDDLDPGTTS